ncbi:hypothetical protein NP493_980g00027 [Ridgeia piscesae]|uniref:Uncharacterized protein n=1 Tax=Ridgeia piscesae TaxID=27915 RepID=A0AAD9KKJ7_RIDPI|nr:hypothetical protein NP493_980g00027 [Ridgeia piscesae]
MHRPLLWGVVISYRIKELASKCGNPTCTDAVNLADQLDTAGFEQHVTGATHEQVADESHSALATWFQRSFKEKIEALCRNRSPLPANDTPTVVSARFDVFEPASPSDVNEIVLASATKSCELDPLPTPLVKHHIDALSPLLARTINASLSPTVFPAPMKQAVVVPIVKKGRSDASVVTYYRPISNIKFVAKMTDRFVAQQLQHFTEENDIYGIYQCAFRIPCAPQCGNRTRVDTQRHRPID